MADLLSQYGIKEVADVTFYKFDKDGKIDYTKPVLYLDTLKVSTIEQTAENVSARGGKGNPELVTWDYNKEITLTLEDALFSAKSLAFMFGTTPDSTETVVTQMVAFDELYSDASATQKLAEVTALAGSVYYKALDEGITAATVKAVLLNDGTYKTITSGSTVKKSEIKGVVCQMTASHCYTIKIDSDEFPEQYGIVGDTYARPVGAVEDELFQFIIYNAKVSSEVTFTLEAEGDPTTFNMSVRVLKPKIGKTMMALKKYDFKA